MTRSTMAATIGFLVATALTPGVAGAAPITVFADKDAEINQLALTSNNGTNSSLIINWAGNERSIGLVEFDLSGLDPSSTINSATLGLFHSINNQLSPVTYNVFRVLSPWAENTVTMATRPGVDGIAIASLTFSGAPGVYRTWDLTAITQGWVSGTFANYGLWIEEVPVGGAATAYFSSSDGFGTERAPRLDIDFTATATPVPEPASMLLLGTGLAGIAAKVRRRRTRAAE